MVAQDVRRLLLEVLDPSAGACTIAISRLVDADPGAGATPQDILHLATATLGSGEVPIGPIEYADEEVDYSVRSDMPVALVTVGGSDPGTSVTLRLGLALASGGCLGVGGSRYGHLPHVVELQDPSAVLLPDIEAALAELVVYPRERALLLGFTGRVEASLEIHAPGPIVPYIVDPESGSAMPGPSLADFEQLRFSYSLDMSTPQIEGAVYDAARELARRFAADAPQFLHDPAAVQSAQTPAAS